MGIYLLWMVTCYFRPGEPLSIQRGDIQIPIQGNSSRHQVLLFPEGRPLRSNTYAANDTVELYCPWCATSLSHGNTTERIFSSSYHDFSVGWSRVIEATRLGEIVQPLVPYMARHSGPSIDAALATRSRKEIKDRGRWKSDRSVLLHRLPAAYQAYALKCENVLHKVISGSTPINSVQMPPVRCFSFCPGGRVALTSW